MSEVFNRLTVLEIKGKHCVCQCVCGKKVERLWQHVKSGKTKSCGCLRQEKAHLLKLKPIKSGEIFGELTVWEYQGKRCFCRCSCGNTCRVSSTHLRTGHTQSCGCLQRQRASQSNLKFINPGARFNRLVVLKQQGDECLCRCDCGKELRVETKKLRNGHTKSCGCLAVEHARQMAQDKLLPPGEAAFNTVFNQYQALASAQQLRFDLNAAEFKQLAQELCFYCNSPPKLTKRTLGLPGSFVYNNIVRINTNLGYSVENCVACCEECHKERAI